MKITKTVLTCLAVLAFFALTTRSARAGESDCSISGVPTPSCSFTGGTPNTLPTQSDTSPFGATLDESTYQNGSVYTYVYKLTDTSGAQISGLNLFATVAGYSLDSFNPAGPFGIVTDQTNFTVTANAGCGAGPFCFGSSSFSVDFGSAFDKSGEMFTFYVTGPAPIAGQLNLNDGGTDAFSPTVSGSEPSVLIQLGASLLLMLAIPFAVRLRRQAA